VGPIQVTEPRDDEAKKNRGVEECAVFPEPQKGYKEKVFFHTLGTDREGKTFISLLNPDLGDGTPLGVVLRFKGKELPKLTEWKMPGKGFYVLGLEPGTVTALGREKLREKGELPFLEGQDSYAISIDFQVLETRKEMESLEREARSLAG
jgi:hypothetical protein